MTGELLTTISTIIGVVSALIAFIVLVGRGSIKAGPFSVDFEKIRSEEAEVRARLSPEVGEPKITRQYKLLQEYQAQGLTQSKISF
jgi:hypothetical protein